jgi:hypothetical protein
MRGKKTRQHAEDVKGVTEGYEERPNKDTACASQGRVSYGSSKADTHIETHAETQLALQAQHRMAAHRQHSSCNAACLVAAGWYTALPAPAKRVHRLGQAERGRHTY